MARKPKLKGDRPNWIGYSITDFDNETVDVGRVAVFFIVFGLVTIVVISMLIFTGWDVIVNKNAFDPQGLGIGVGGLLGGISTVLMGLGVYLFGDSRSKEALEALGNIQGNQQYFKDNLPHRGMQHDTTQNRQGFAQHPQARTRQAESSSTVQVQEGDYTEGGAEDGATGSFAPIGTTAGSDIRS